MELTQNQITFMKRMEEEILPNRKNIDIPLMVSVASLVGIKVNTSCRTCAAAGGADMLNLYGQLKPEYDKWVKNQVPITTQFEAAQEDIKEEIVEPVVIKKKKVIKDED